MVQCSIRAGISSKVTWFGWRNHETASETQREEPAHTRNWGVTENMSERALTASLQILNHRQKCSLSLKHERCTKSMRTP